MARQRLLGTMVALVGIWLTVALAAVFGGDIVSETRSTGGKVRIRSRSRVPAVVVVAAMAGAATFFVTWFAYRSDRARAIPTAAPDTERPTRELDAAFALRDRATAVGQREKLAATTPSR